MSVTAPPRSPRARDRDEFDAIVEALIEEARQHARRRRRRAGAAAAVVALVGAAIAITAGTGVTPSPELAAAPAARTGTSGSPATPQIAFAVAAPGVSGYEINVVSPDGTGLRRVVGFESAYGPHTPVWSPDGRKIAFVSMPNGDEDIFVVNTDGSGVRNLTGNPLGEYGPRWSADGQAIAFERFTYFSTRVDSNNSVILMNADGSAQRSLASGGGPVWSPDGRMIAFTNFRRGGSAAVVNADGSELRTLADNASPVAWSPDRRKVLLGRRVGWDEADRVPERVDLYVVDIDGPELRRLQRGVAVAAWSPDGRHVAFEYYRGPAGVYVMNADGSGLRKLTEHGGGPAWSPDGRMIAFQSDRATPQYPQIYLVNADGSDERQLTDNRVSSELTFSWSPLPAR
jgi:TolB protein